MWKPQVRVWLQYLQHPGAGWQEWIKGKRKTGTRCSKWSTSVSAGCWILKQALRVFKHELTSKECGLPLPLLHWDQPDNLPITRTICYHIKRDFFSLYHTFLSWGTFVFGTESSHCFRNVGGMMCLLRRGYEPWRVLRQRATFCGRQNGNANNRKLVSQSVCYDKVICYQTAYGA